MKSICYFGILILFPILAFSQNKNVFPEPLKILLVTAHPDDDALFSGFAYRMTHDFGAKVDLVLATNGEGGFRYSTLAEPIYGLNLTNEKIGRENLPRIRKMELMNGGKITGIRQYFFLDEQDSVFTTNMEDVFNYQWNTKSVIERYESILKRGKYDLVITMLATEATHGAHKGAAVLMMQTIQKLPKEKRPIVVSGTMFNHEQKRPEVYGGLPGYPITKVSHPNAFFTFDRTQKFGFNEKLNYQIIANWVIAEHKSQGTMQNLMNRGEIECYWYLDFNDPTKFDALKKIFAKTSPQIGN